MAFMQLMSERRAEWGVLRARRWPILIVGPVTVLTNWARPRLTMHCAAPFALRAGLCVEH